MSKFRVGDVVEYCGLHLYAHGEQATVLEIAVLMDPVQVTTGRRESPVMCCRLDRDVTGNGAEWFEVASLRKRRPPEEPGSWEEIEKLTRWNPTRVTA